MSDEKGNNKRIVKKTNKCTKTMNIKISTEDKDPIIKSNKTLGNKNVKKKTSAIKYSYLSQEEDNDVFQKTKTLEKELNKLKIKMNKTAEKEFKQIESLNNKISVLQDEQNEATKENNKLLSKLRDIEKDVSKKFNGKFKLSKIISKQKSQANERNINIEIKSKEGQKKTVQKNIEYNKKEVEKLTNMLEQSKEGGDDQLNQELIELNQKINDYKKEIRELNKLKYEHQYCEKIKSALTSKLNVLSNDIEFENKKQIMIDDVEKKEPTKIKILSKNMAYSQELRKKSLQNTEKYNTRNNLLKYKLFKDLTKDFDEKIESNLNTSRNYKNKSNINQHYMKTSANVQRSSFSSSKKIDITSRVDSSMPKNFLFSEKEKEILNQLIPEEYMNNFNERYNNVENQINKIEEEKTAEFEKMKDEKDNCKIQIDILNLKIKEESMKIIKKNVSLVNNHKKISQLKQAINLINKEIKNANANISKLKKNNENIKKIIIKVKEQKEEEKMKEEEEEPEEEN